MPDQTIHVLVTIALDNDLTHRLQALSPRFNFHFAKTRKVEDISEETWQRTEILYTDVVLPAPKLAPLLRWVQLHWAGIDWLADAPILHEPDVTATTLSGAAASQLAEYILLGLLALGRRLPALTAAQRQVEWPGERWQKFAPHELRGSTIGFIGYGSVARQAARLLAPFGATLLATKRNAMQPADSGYTPEGQGDPDASLLRRLYPTQALRSMLKECDFVVVTIPLTPETRGLVGADEFAALKPGAFFIDVSRGGVVDQPALIKALKSGKLGGAMLDVFPEEPLPPDNPLWKLPNVIITPHISGISPHYNARAMELFSVNLLRYLNNQELFNVFDLERGY